MELLDYQLDDIRRAIREYAEKFSEAEVMDWDSGVIKVVWQTDAQERAALIEICSLIDNKYFEAVARGISG